MYCVRLKLILIAKLWIFSAVTIVMRSSHLRWVTYALTVSRSISFICYNPIYVDISSDNSIITNRMKPKTDSPKWTYRSALNHFRVFCKNSQHRNLFDLIRSYLTLDKSKHGMISHYLDDICDIFVWVHYEKKNCLMSVMWFRW